MARDVIGIPDEGDLDDGVLAAYLDGALTDVERVRLEARLARDTALARRLDAERALRTRATALLDALELPAARAAASDLAHVRARAAEAQRAAGPAAPRHRGPRLLPFAWAATVVAALGVGALFNAARHEAAEAPAVASVGTTGESAASAPMASDAPPAPAAAAPPSTRVVPGSATTARAARTPDRADTTAPLATGPLVAAAPTAAPAAAHADSIGERGDAATGNLAAARAAEARTLEAAPAAARVALSDEARARDARAAAPMAAQPPDGAARRAIGVAEATTILGTTLRTIGGTTITALEAVPGRSWEGARPDRDAVQLRLREPSGRTITLVQQRAAADDRTDARLGWRVLGPVRLRLVGEFSPATADSLWRRVEP